MEKIKELLINKYDNHVMPFLWMHGESEEVIRKYVKAIHESDIQSICIESRPHKDFLEEKWWHDVDTVIDECEKYGMTIWILDDKHFPTGYAAGEIQKKYPMLQKEYLDFTKLDFVGPKDNAGIILDWVTSSTRPNVMSVGTEKSVEKEFPRFDSRIIEVVAARKTSFREIDTTSLISLTSKIVDSTLFWDIPDGEWSIYIFYTTQEGKEASTVGYLNPLVPEATDVLIKTVYQAHYEHYSEKFGNTIQGFFSDEPRFGNIKGPDAILGKVDMPLPWRADFENDFAKKLGWPLSEVLLHLPLLFTGDSDKAHEMRYHYMELVSNLYSKNFSSRIGDWCKAHRVEYIGHVIEDNNAHSRLGYGAGHFFKSMAGQDMAGIDVVLHQLTPQQNNGYFDSFTSTGWDGEFFHYALAKMGASLGNLDPSKKGRTMCEVYGAYGWSEGTKLMKWITDHMLVRGVNYFVPHAFSMSDFPDSDCPPHFYAHGQNPEYRAFRQLMEYTNRLSFLFSNGKHKADIAVLYNAEAEWSGETMLLQKVTRVLTENQFEFDIVSCDMLIETVLDGNSGFSVENHLFKTLIVPYAERLPAKLISKLREIAKDKVKLIFIDELVKAASENIPMAEEITSLKSQVEIVSINQLVNSISNKNYDQLVTDSVLPYLRYFHYSQDGKSVYMLFNENTTQDISFQGKFPNSNSLKGYDPIGNKVIKLETIEDGYCLTLKRAETMILFEDDEDLETYVPTKGDVKTQRKLNENLWQITFNSEEYMESCTYDELPIIGMGDKYTHFSGTISYETSIPGNSDAGILQIEEASEIVTVYLNDEVVGTKISQPYTFDLGKKFTKDSNVLKIEVTNNLGRKMRDYLSQFILLEPLGISGLVELAFEKEETK